MTKNEDKTVNFQDLIFNIELDSLEAIGINKDNNLIIEGSIINMDMINKIKNEKSDENILDKNNKIKVNYDLTTNSAFLLRSFNGIIDVSSDAINPKNHLAVQRDGEIILVPYKKGIATATETQIISDEIKQGDKIVVGYIGQASKNTQTKNNRQRGGMMGGPGPR